MNETSLRTGSVELAHRVEAFEAALDTNASADMEVFLPPTTDPLFLPVLVELVRIDLERSWRSGRGKRLDDYAARYPSLLGELDLLKDVALEECRQRRRAGQEVPLEEYRLRFGIDTSDWSSHLASASCGSTPQVQISEREKTSLARTPPPMATAEARALIAGRPEDRPTGRMPIHPVRQLVDEDSLVISSLQQAAESLPPPGTMFLGFRLEEELGRGAFGRVYLARQGDLAGRPVALKVACNIHHESQTLAQLQHTNIVPIYSFHRVGQYQAVCMPYFGRTTLAHVLRNITSQRALPSSGKELRTTLDLGKDLTVGSAVPPGTVPPAADAPSTPGTSSGIATTGAVPSHNEWARLEGLSYIEVILTLGMQLADGLAHAHRRGILHRDLKPANILLTDDGRPMLLDFNLAEDMKARTATQRASIGGTLPYMAPEQLEAYRTGQGRLDERCDLFSLGVILFELLTGRHPYPTRKGCSPETLVAMVADRRQSPPSLREHNLDLSPAVEALIRKCLAADPAERYQHAEDLRDDIDRHLNHRALKFAGNPSTSELVRKWARRHPRLTSSATIAAVSIAVLAAAIGGTLYARERSRGLEARGRFADHQYAFRDTQAFLDDRNRSWHRLDEGLNRLQAVLGRYGVADDLATDDSWRTQASLWYLPEADRARVEADIGEAFYSMAQIAYLKGFAAMDPARRAAECERAWKWNALADRYAGERLPRAVREQRAAIAELRGDAALAEHHRRDAEAVPLEAARDLYLLGSQLTRQNRHRDALRPLERSTRLDPENFSAWFVRGSAHLELEQYEFAAMCYSSCVSLHPDFAPAWMYRGLAFAGLRFRELAVKDFSRALALDPNLIEAYVHRAEALEADGDHAGAEKDYSTALASGKAPARIHFLRARVRQELGDQFGAQADRAAGLKAMPADEMSWIARAEHRLDDPQAALADVDEALKLNPMSVFGLQLKAHILGERLGRADDAMAVLDRAVKFHPDHVPTRAGRGVALARAGKREEAHRDAEAALRLDSRAPNLYQVAGIYALTSRTHREDRREAFRLLWESLRAGFGLDLVKTDADLDPIRAEKEFVEIVRDAEALEAARQGRAVPAEVKK